MQTAQTLNLGALPRINGLTVTQAAVTPRMYEAHLVCTIVGDPQFVAAFKNAIDVAEAVQYVQWGEEQSIIVVSCRGNERPLTAATALLIMGMETAIQTATAHPAEELPTDKASQREPKPRYRRPRPRSTSIR